LVSQVYSALLLVVTYVQQYNQSPDEGNGLIAAPTENYLCDPFLAFGDILRALSAAIESPFANVRSANYG
jgi:hypothetical protein